MRASSQHPRRRLSLITNNGLNVPAIGEGGRPATPKQRRENRRDTGTRRRWTNAEDLRRYDTLRGPKTLGIYTVLDVDHDGGMVDITVRAPSGAIRHWTRRPDFPLERG